MPFHKKPKFPWVYAEYYDRFDFYNGREKWLETYNALPEGGRNLWCVHWTYLEISNGGFWQYFYNSTGTIAPEAVTAYSAIGMNDVAAVIRAALAKLPVPFPGEKADREKIVGPPDSRMNFEEEDLAFYKLTETPKWFFSKPRHHEFTDRYAIEFCGLKLE